MKDVINLLWKAAALIGYIIVAIFATCYLLAGLLFFIRVLNFNIN